MLGIKYLNNIKPAFDIIDFTRFYEELFNKCYDYDTMQYTLDNIYQKNEISDIESFHPLYGSNVIKNFTNNIIKEYIWED